MTTANHLVNALAAQDQEEADNAFNTAIQERLADFLEVRKVELASTIMDDLVQEGKEAKHTHQVVYTVPGEGKEKQYFHVTADDEDHAREQLKDAQPTAKIHKVEKINEGAGSTAARQYIRQVGAIGRAFTKDGKKTRRSIHQSELKAHAAKNVKKLGADEVQRHADLIRDTRRGVKIRAKIDAMKEETLEEAVLKRHILRAMRDKYGEGTIQISRDGSKVHHYRRVLDDEGNDYYQTKTHAVTDGQLGPRIKKSKGKEYAVSEGTLDEVLSGGSASNAQLGKNVVANIRRATQALGLKGVNPNMAAQGHKDFAKLVAKNPKAPGYMLLRKLAPAKAAAVQTLTQAGVPLGSALDAHPTEFNQVVQRIKRFK